MATTYWDFSLLEQRVYRLPRGIEVLCMESSSATSLIEQIIEQTQNQYDLSAAASFLIVSSLKLAAIVMSSTPAFTLAESAVGLTESYFASSVGF